MICEYDMMLSAVFLKHNTGIPKVSYRLFSFMRLRDEAGVKVTRA